VAQQTPVQDWLRGSFVPLVTPFREGEVDLSAYARLVEQQVAGGSDGLVITGTSGEPNVLSIQERVTLVQAAVDGAAGRMPVVAATGSQSLPETLELTRAAEAAGADALLVVTPYYIKPPQDGLADYFVAVAGATSLPVLIYHIPGRSGVTMLPGTVAEVVQRCENVVGMKHAATDLGYLSELLHRLGPDFRVFSGLEELGFPMLAMGACGVMNAVGNLAPSVVGALCAAVRDGDLDRARALHYQLLEVNQAIFWETNPIPLKFLMRELGLLDDNEHRLPMRKAAPALEDRLRSLLARNSWLSAPAGVGSGAGAGA
jgi:4-hydroxy-tetrahydrodipicolinate synthase